jgi:hypothetical protein
VPDAIKMFDVPIGQRGENVIYFNVRTRHRHRHRLLPSGVLACSRSRRTFRTTAVRLLRGELTLFETWDLSSTTSFAA